MVTRSHSAPVKPPAAPKQRPTRQQRKRQSVDGSSSSSSSSSGRRRVTWCLGLPGARGPPVSYNENQLHNSAWAVAKEEAEACASDDEELRDTACSRSIVHHSMSGMSCRQIGDRVQAFNAKGTLYLATIVKVHTATAEYTLDWDDCDPVGRVVRASDVLDCLPGKHKPSQSDRLRMAQRQSQRERGEWSSEQEEGEGEDDTNNNADPAENDDGTDEDEEEGEDDSQLPTSGQVESLAARAIEAQVSCTGFNATLTGVRHTQNNTWAVEYKQVHRGDDCDLAEFHNAWNSQSSPSVYVVAMEVEQSDGAEWGVKVSLPCPSRHVCPSAIASILR